ncbi:MAG: TRAM domain-containing protein, partial [Planctomycetota bacterium]
KLADSIPPEVKQQRNVKLLEVISEIAEEDNKRFLGQTLEVLVEGPSKKPHLDKAENQNNPQLIARTAHDYIVVFNGPESLTGRFVTVTVTKTAPLTLFAKLTSPTLCPRKSITNTFRECLNRENRSIQQTPEISCCDKDR